MQPLSGLKVIDFSRVLAGPFCSMNLADLGADVIKVETIIGGDETRAWGPPFAGTESAYYLGVNRNKRSLAVNLKSVAGQAITQRLVAHADVVLHNFLPHSVAKLGLSYEQLASQNPALIVCSITGYGSHSDDPGYDFILQAMGGLMSITGERDGSPMKVGVAITDLFTGLYAANAIQAALLYRARSGKGQFIDMALYDAQIAILANVASNVLIGDDDAPRLGNYHPNIVPYQSFQTADGYIVLTVGNDRQFRDFCTHMDIPEVGINSNYATNELRVMHRQELTTLLEAHLLKYASQEIIDRMQVAHVPCGPIRSVKEALTAKATQERQMILSMTHAQLGDIAMLSSPMKLSESPVTYRQPPPLHGQHNREILVELGFGQQEITKFINEGVISIC